MWWVAAGVIVVAGVLLVAASQLELRVHIERVVAFFRDAGAWSFFTAMAILPVAGFPMSAFNVVAGPVFGPALGVGTVIACAALALAINLALSYWLAARVMRPPLERLVKRMGYTVPDVPSHSAWEITLLVRIVPGPPVVLQSYLLALARVPFGIYMVVSMLVHTAFMVATILAGDALMRGDGSALLFAGGLIVVVGFIVHRLRRRFAAMRAPGSIDGSDLNAKPPARE